jgi:hypothetical protein
MKADEHFELMQTTNDNKGVYYYLHEVKELLFEILFVSVLV